MAIRFTSAYWRPFLHPDVRLLVPPETLSVWYRLFHGPAGTLNVVVEELPPGATVRELEGLPVLAPESAVVDALEAFQERRNGNLLALVDTLVHGLDTLDPTLALAGNRGLEGDVAFLRDHRRRGGTRLLGPRDVRRAHEVEADLAGVPPGTRFTDLVTSREAYRP